MSSKAQKTRLRCPECKTATIKQRRRSTPRWRCRQGHTFARPATGNVEVTAFQANYPNSFIALGNAVSVSDLKGAALRANDQLSIEEIDANSLSTQVISGGPAARDMLEHYLQANGPDPQGYSHSLDPDGSRSRDPYSPGIGDTRERIIRSIALRKGQSTFRKRLIRRYGPACMISGCQLTDIVEAAHIWPHRADRDNHPDNGLLLRADLHTLFDLDLLGIDPEKWTVQLHPDALAAGYSAFQGLRLRMSGRPRPSGSGAALTLGTFPRTPRPANVVASQTKVRKIGSLSAGPQYNHFLFLFS